MIIETVVDRTRNTATTLFFLVTLPFVLLWRLVISFFIQKERRKAWRRVIGDGVYRWFLSTQSIPFIAYVVGSSSRTYETWCRQNGVKPNIESIEAGAKLFWIGNKRPDRVILYIHGGGFSLPLADYSVKFWRYVQIKLRDVGIETSIAILDYTLIPDVHFPVPLRQIIASVHHLISNGIRPENIQITGDSAGGNLITQLLLHMLHPLDGIPSLKPGTRLRGAYLMSPWSHLTIRNGIRSYTENANRDVIDKTLMAYSCDRVVAGVPDKSFLPYIDASYAPPGWYKNVDNTVERVLITAGGAECIRDDIVEFAGNFRRAHAGAELVVDKFGVHDDPLLDFVFGETSAELTPVIIQWFIDGFSKRG